MADGQQPKAEAPAGGEGGAGAGGEGGGRGRGGKRRGKGGGVRRPAGPPFTCLRCQEEFDTRDLLQDHLTASGHRNARPDGAAAPNPKPPREPREPSERKARPPRPPSCRVCAEKFDTKELLNTHLDESGHRGGNPRPRPPLVCYFCRESFADRDALHAHFDVTDHRNKRREGEEAAGAAQEKA
mmetsp:Transcript_27448/g.53545  ORF Transcript_27448/g.53545 Transcript_27448/m.53545 type:complete len:184 (+) Transcript_27448:122-673(+)|eukprot:CAMPEP_0173391772 /NCGR_PEP_ID=MMETSP1356-20130122/18580_1 /TAXON_ID=77927 ORGANISM="Hemiselmis virescens, Strain PCC157" /NCGR_SAMPLE_ID=MMETSP1356 /ASSEMBLY_ACC=CAM_ASM_000847 /LENGTH=183 /DNA_ID=CAMNT_0014349461 /DNA_START=122 /DNA_END=673 /DNA_ORIENTATION=-